VTSELSLPLLYRWDG